MIISSYLSFFGFYMPKNEIKNKFSIKTGYTIRKTRLISTLFFLNIISKSFKVILFEIRRSKYENSHSKHASTRPFISFSDSKTYP